MSYPTGPSVWFTPLYLSLTLLLFGAWFGPVPVRAQSMQFVQVASLGATQVFVTGDLNHDGKPDLVLISDPPDGNGKAYVQLGNGDGTFGPPTTYPIAPVAVFSAGQAKLADLRGTGDLDLIAPSVDSNNIFVLLGKGNGTLQPSVSYPTSFFQTNEVIAGDFNGDKKLDLGLVEWKLEHGGARDLSKYSWAKAMARSERRSRPRRSQRPLQAPSLAAISIETGHWTSRWPWSIPSRSCSGTGMALSSRRLRTLWVGRGRGSEVLSLPILTVTVF